MNHVEKILSVLVILSLLVLLFILSEHLVLLFALLTRKVYALCVRIRRTWRRHKVQKTILNSVAPFFRQRSHWESYMNLCLGMCLLCPLEQLEDLYAGLADGPENRSAAAGAATFLRLDSELDKSGSWFPHLTQEARPVYFLAKEWAEDIVEGGTGR